MNTLNPSPLEAPHQPEVVSPQELFERIRKYDGSSLVGEHAWTVKQRAGDKGFSTDFTQEGACITRTPGPEHEGMEWSKAVATSTKSLLTLTRHALRPIFGETVAQKSEDYKAEQADMANLITGLAEKMNAHKAKLTLTAEEDAELQVAHQEVLNAFDEFVYGRWFNEVMTDENSARSRKAFSNLVTIVAGLLSDHQGAVA